MHPFFRPKRALSAAPHETPYQRAGQIWDERTGLALAHARNWRRLAIANLALAAFLGAGWWRQAPWPAGCGTCAPSPSIPSCCAAAGFAPTT